MNHVLAHRTEQRTLEPAQATSARSLVSCLGNRFHYSLPPEAARRAMSMTAAAGEGPRRALPDGEGRHAPP